MKYLIPIILSIISISSCQNKEYIFYPDLDEEYRRILRLSEDEFKTKLQEEFNGKSDYQNLLEYLKSIAKENGHILKPSKKLQLQINRGNIIRDIWNVDKTINQDGKFIKCISKSKSKFLSEYYSRIRDVGDVSPTVIAEGLINYIELNEKDEYIFPIATINFYLITLN